MRWACAAFVVGALFISCGGSSVPLDEWEAQWRGVLATVEAVATRDVTEEVCEQTLGYLRAARPELAPPPIEDLEAPVDDWFREAEDAFFECVLVDPAATDRVLETLTVLEREVDVVLDLEG